MTRKMIIVVETGEELIVSSTEETTLQEQENMLSSALHWVLLQRVKEEKTKNATN